MKIFSINGSFNVITAFVQIEKTLLVMVLLTKADLHSVVARYLLHGLLVCRRIWFSSKKNAQNRDFFKEPW